MQQIKIPARLLDAITTPHQHEGKGNPPLWLIWKLPLIGKDALPNFPELDSVADSQKSARYHVLALLDDIARGNDFDIYVERVPANHKFGSSLGKWQDQIGRQIFTGQLRYFRRDA